MVVVKLGVVKGEPVCTGEPPVAALNHSTVPLPVALSVTVPVPQFEPPVAVGADGRLMVM